MIKNKSHGDWSVLLHHWSSSRWSLSSPSTPSPCSPLGGGLVVLDSVETDEDDRRMEDEDHVRIRSVPGNSTLPRTISAMIQPTDQTSTVKINTQITTHTHTVMQNKSMWTPNTHLSAFIFTAFFIKQITQINRVSNSCLSFLIPRNPKVTLSLEFGVHIFSLTPPTAVLRLVTDEYYDITRIQSRPGKRILCRTISAIMQPTAQISTFTQHTAEQHKRKNKE